MDNALILLQQLTVKELQVEPRTEATDEKIRLFIRQFQLDLKKYHNKPMTAEALLTKVYFAVIQFTPPIIDADSRDKIDLLRALIFTGNSKSRLNHALNNLSTVLQKMKDHSLEEVHQLIIDNGIKKYMNRINNSLKTNDTTLSAQTFLDLGTFIQEQFSGVSLDRVRKELKSYSDQYLEHELPELTEICRLYDARIRLMDHAVTNNDLNAIYKYDALGKGINIYSMLMGEARIAPLLVEQSMDSIEDAITPIISTNYQPPPLLSKLIAANNIIVQLQKLNTQCLKDLGKIIVTEAKKLPETVLNEFIRSSSLNNTYEIKIDLLTNAIVDNSDKSTALLRCASDNLKSAAQSYLVINKLDQTLKTEAYAEERLKTYKIKFEEPHIQSVLTTNADSLINKFIKVVSYLLSKAVHLATFGAIPVYTEKPKFDSHQQNLFKETTQNLRDAEDKDLFKLNIK